MKDPMEVCPLARGVIWVVPQLLSAPLQHGLRFLHLPLPAVLSAHLAMGFPRMGEDYGLTTFHVCTIVMG